MSKKQLTFDDRLAIQAGLQQGQSVPVICENHLAGLPVSDRTIYSYYSKRVCWMPGIST